MFTYNEDNKCIVAFPEHGVLLFARKFMEGDSWEVPSHVPAPGQTVTISILPKGSIRTLNTNREEPLDIPSGPGLIFGGLMLPGTYTLIGLEDNTEYVCMTRHIYGEPPHVQYTKDDWDYHLTNSTLIDEGEEVSVPYSEKTRLVVCLWGSATGVSNLRESVIVSAGNGVELLEGETLTFTKGPGDAAELAWTVGIPSTE